jgi:hypothetical protein
MTIETVTRKEACELIRKSIGKDVPEGEVFDKIVFAVNNDMQVRDFMLGLPKYYDLQEVIDFLCHMAAETKLGEDIPFIVVAGAMAYEVDAMEEFYKHVGYAAVHAPNYSLNNILMKAANAGYPGKMLTKMREELHVKVMEVCYKSEPDFIITKIGETDGKHIPSATNVSSSSEDSGRETSGQTESGSTPNTESQPGSN